MNTNQFNYQKRYALNKTSPSQPSKCTCFRREKALFSTNTVCFQLGKQQFDCTWGPSVFKT